MKTILLALAACLALAIPRLCCAKNALPDIGVTATTRVQVSASDTQALRNLVTKFAAEHGFPHREESTMPRNRKIFLVRGAFSTTYSSKDDRYLLVHNAVGKDCVFIDLYVAAGEPPDKQLMAGLQRAIEKAMPKRAAVVDSRVCPDED